METVRQLMSPRVVLGGPEQRLSQLAEQIHASAAQYCAVLDENNWVVGLIRFGDVAARGETSTRILSDLMKRPRLETVSESDRPEMVQRLFERGGPQEIVVTAVDSLAFVGLITPESFSVWLLRNEQKRKAELERLVEEQKRLADFLERKVASQLSGVRETLNEFGSLCVSLSHDIRQPLRTIQAFADLLASGEGGELNPGGREAVARIAAVAGKAETLAETVLDKARLSFGDTSRTLAVIDLNVVVADALEFLEAEIRHSQAQVRVEGRLSTITGYYVPVLQVFINLLVNALHHVSPGLKPAVAVWTEERDREVFLYVRDNGLGMSEEQRAVLSAPSGDHYDSAPSGGGHGLKITRNAVSVLGGRINVSSAELGGTLFVITLPRAKALSK